MASQQRQNAFEESSLIYSCRFLKSKHSGQAIWLGTLPERPTAPPKCICSTQTGRQTALKSRRQGWLNHWTILRFSRNSCFTVAMAITDAHLRSTQGPAGNQRTWSHVLHCWWILSASSWPATFQGKEGSCDSRAPRTHRESGHLLSHIQQLAGDPSEVLCVKVNPLYLLFISQAWAC